MVLNVVETFARRGYRLATKFLSCLMARARFPLVEMFSDVPGERAFRTLTPRGRLSIGINQWNFAVTYKVGEGAQSTFSKEVRHADDWQG